MSPTDFNMSFTADFMLSIPAYYYVCVLYDLFLKAFETVLLLEDLAADNEACYILMRPISFVLFLHPAICTY